MKSIYFAFHSHCRLLWLLVYCRLLICRVLWVVRPGWGTRPVIRLILPGWCAHIAENTMTERIINYVNKNSLLSCYLQLLDVLLQLCLIAYKMVLTKPLPLAFVDCFPENLKRSQGSLRSCCSFHHWWCALCNGCAARFFVNTTFFLSSAWYSVCLL